jgi:Domain of unknown function (DUF4389)
MTASARSAPPSRTTCGAVRARRKKSAGDPPERSPVDVQVNLSGVPTVRTALLRLVFSLPALLLVAVLSIASGFVWLLAALAALVSERVPRALAEFLLLAIRVRFRFIAYHLSLVDRYPSLADQSVNHPVPA